MAQWDGNTLLRIADIGYVADGTPGDDQFSIVFLPGYPLAVAAVQLVVRDFLAAGLLVSFAGSVGAAYFLYRLVRLDADHATAMRAVLLWRE